VNDPTLLRNLYGVSDSIIGKKLMWAAHMSLYSAKVSYPEAKLHLINIAIKYLQEAKTLL
jgi:hypothetical protein